MPANAHRRVNRQLLRRQPAHPVPHQRHPPQLPPAPVLPSQMHQIITFSCANSAAIRMPDRTALIDTFASSVASSRNSNVPFVVKSQNTSTIWCYTCELISIDDSNLVPNDRPKKRTEKPNKKYTYANRFPHTATKRNRNAQTT